MKKIIYSTIISLLIMSQYACEKVIDVDLDEADQELVIEALLEEGLHNFQVIISKTAPYFDNQPTEKIDNATVTLSDGGDNTYAIPNINDGTYEALIHAEANKTYTLRVELDGNEYTAESYLPGQVQLDTVYAEYEEGFGPQDEGYVVYFKYTDPANTDNYYRVRHYLNDELQNTGEDMQIFNDNLNDGNTVRYPLFLKTFDFEDTVAVELIHFDEASYDYFNSLADISGASTGPNSGSAAPGNPISNWTGNILGYFSAYSNDSLTLIITE